MHSVIRTGRVNIVTRLVGAQGLGALSIDGQIPGVFTPIGPRRTGLTVRECGVTPRTDPHVLCWSVWALKQKKLCRACSWVSACSCLSGIWLAILT